MPVLTYIEFNDGCSCQFKCIATFTQYACCSVPTNRIFFETSHGKSKSDGLGEVVKGFATREVNAKEVIIHNTSTRNIHQVFNDTSSEKGIYHHQFACVCEKYLMQIFDECFYLKETSTTFSYCQHLIKAKWHSFVTKPENSTSDSEDSEDDSGDKLYYPETEASLLVKKDDIAVIKTSICLNYHVGLTLWSKLQSHLPCQPQSHKRSLLGNFQQNKCW